MAGSPRAKVDAISLYFTPEPTYLTWANLIAGPIGQPTCISSLRRQRTRRLIGTTSIGARRASLPGVYKKAANATLVTTLPDSSARPFLAHVLSTPGAFVGIWFFEISAKVPARHTLPLQKTAAGAFAFELRMQRRAAADDGLNLKAMLAANDALLPRLQAAGGKIYPPYCPILSKEQWQVHYGPETWPRFAAAKRRFDPNNVLTPRSGNFLSWCFLLAHL